MLASLINAIDFIHEINHSDLPIAYHDNISIVSFPNATLNFDYGIYSSGISSVVLDNTDTYNLSILTFIPSSIDFGNYTENITAWALNISNSSINNISTNILININVLNDTPSSVQIVQLGTNTFQYETCDTALPLVTNFITSFLTTYETTSTCESDFIKCPKLLNENTTQITINISVPKTTIPGDYSAVAKFGIDNFDNITFKFKINDCIAEVDDLCNTIEGVPNLVVCDKVLVQSLIERNLTPTAEIITIYQNTTEIELREVFDISDEDKVRILSNIENITGQALLTTSRLRDIMVKIDEKDKQLNILLGEKDSLTAQIPTLVSQSVSDLNRDNKNLTARLNEQEGTTWNKFKVIFWLVTIVLISVGGFFSWKYLEGRAI